MPNTFFYLFFRAKKSLLFLTFCVVYSYYCTAQSPKQLADSTYNNLIKSFIKYREIDSLKALKYRLGFLEKAKKEKDTIAIIRGGYLLADFYESYTTNHISFLNSVIKATKKNPSKLLPAYAYYQKGHFYYSLKNKQEEALKNFLLGLKALDKVKNDSLKNIVKFRIAKLKSDNNKYREAIKLYKEIYNYSTTTKKLYFLYEVYTLEELSRAYSEVGKYDSASSYNQKILKLAKKYNNNYSYNSFNYRKGYIQFKLKQYKKAIENFKKTIPLFIVENEILSLFDCYGLIAKSYTKLESKEKALKYYLLIDSLYKKTKITHQYQSDSYRFLVNYYKNKKDIKNQLKYFNQLILVDSILQSENKEVARTIIKEYDIPNLLEEKEQTITQLKNEVSIEEKIKYIAITVLLSIFLLLIYQIRNRNILKKRFEILQNNLQAQSSEKQVVEKFIKKPLRIPEEITTKILKGLEQFEKEQGFIDTSLTLIKLASTLETNSNYLSKIINHHKGMNFSRYLTSLRINHTLKALDRNMDLRKYSIKAIAEEVGFNNTESFAKAFYKKTGLKPSYYIKQLQKSKVA